MDKSKDIENKIKASFENIQHEAPKNLWTSIGDKLDSTPTPLDDKVKSSFEKHNNNSAPEGVWASIDKQLTVDRGWKKIHYLLRRRTVYKWTKRIAAFLIFLFFISPEVNINLTEEKTLEENKNTPLLASNEKESNPSLMKKNALINPKDKGLPLLNTKAKTKLLSNVEGVSSIINREYVAGVIQTKPFVEKQSNKKELSTEYNYNSNLGKNKISSLLLTEANLNKKTSDSFIVKSLPIKKVTHLPSNNKNTNLINLENDLQKEKKFEFGSFTAINSTAIINNTTRRALDANSLVALNPSYGASLGFQFIYRFNKKHSLASSVLHSSVNQSYNKFSNGSLNEEVFSANFIRIQAMYQHSYKRFETKKTSFTFKIGPYAGFTTNSSLAVNHEVKSEPVDHFKNYDLGITLQAGQSYELKKLIFDYGLNIDKGLTNLNKGTHKIPASFDRTTVLGLGCYLSVRYKF